MGGIFLGGFIAAHFFANPNPIAISAETHADLVALGIQDFDGYLPTDIFSFTTLFSFKSFVFVVLGGFLVGFGTRYGNGCTSGHAITGLSNLQWPSLVSTICFFIGGLIVTHFVLPLLF